VSCELLQGAISYSTLSQEDAAVSIVLVVSFAQAEPSLLACAWRLASLASAHAKWMFFIRACSYYHLTRVYGEYTYDRCCDGISLDHAQDQKKPSIQQHATWSSASTRAQEHVWRQDCSKF